MKKLLLAALVLTGLAGCSKSDPAPTPTVPAAKPQLEGVWETTTIHSVEKTPAGVVTLEETNTIPAGSETITITSTDFIIDSSTSHNTKRAYTRKGDVLSFVFDSDLTIQEVSDTKLVLVGVSTVVHPPNVVTNTFTYQRK